MKVKNAGFFRGGLGRIVLQWLNLRPDECDRTLLMFVVYTTTSIGMLWLENSTVALFLGNIGADQLPWIYISSAVVGIILGFLSSWMQTTLPLRQFIVVTALLIAAPLLLFRLGLQNIATETQSLATQFSMAQLTVFLMPLWVDVSNALNQLNTSITANQLFNIREIKRTYPLISSGVLVADVLSGFSLPFLLKLIGLPNVILAACFMMLLGALIVFYLSRKYKQAFPDAPQRDVEDSQNETRTRRLRGPVRQYAWLLLLFFLLAQALVLLIDFQFQTQLQLKFEGKEEEIASFLALFSASVGLCELATQWFVSGRAIERMGVFRTIMLPPTTLAVAALFPLTGLNLFIGLILLKFLDDLLRYTLLASTGPVLFQPIPENLRGAVETQARGIAEPIATGLTGAGILVAIHLIERFVPKDTNPLQYPLLGWLVIGGIVLFSLTWLLSVWLLRSRYLNLLVLSAQRGQLGITNVNLGVLKQAVVEALTRPGAEEDKRSCIELLTQIDPQNVGDVLAPLLVTLPPALQRQSLEVMLEHPNPAYLNDVQALIEQTPPPEVLALALRYVWLTQPELDIRSIKHYLHTAVEPTVRGTAAALILRRGTPTEKAEATNTLRRMLTSKRERERVMGTRALGEAEYLQALRLYIPSLLQDESLRVRCALLEVIAATRLEEYYPSLVRGLSYKSTREAARTALVRLGDEAIGLLIELAEDVHKPDLMRLQAWTALAQIGTPETLKQLVQQLMTSWGTTRRNILRILLQIPKEAGDEEAGIEAVLDRIGRSGVEALIEQELLFLGQIYAAVLDLDPEKFSGREADLLRRGLQDMQTDLIERCFLLMKFLYPLSAIQAAAFNLESESRSNVALGLEILDNTIDIPQKKAFLAILDRRSTTEKLTDLAELLPYHPMSPSDRLRRLIEFRHFMADWPLACCFHLARVAHYSLTPEATIVCLRHPTGFVREAVLAYLKAASPRACSELLPALVNDSDRLVAAQVQQMIEERGNG